MMERLLMGVLYLSGWFATCRPHQYHFVAQKVNWTEAQTYCRATYKDLATVENTEDMNQLNQTVHSAGYKENVWIGLYNNIDWKWSDGYRGSGAEYRGWESHQPNFMDTELCVCTGSTRHSWWDDECRFKHEFICFNGTWLNPAFFIVAQEMNWTEAQRYCRENFVDLATVKSDTENQKVENLTSKSWKWIGMYRNSDINWSDGSVYSFSKLTVRPLESVKLVKKFCGVQVSNEWKFMSCGKRFPFVCHGIPRVKKHLVKMRVKLQDSSVDLNDPDVKAEVLKKFQDRLKEQGVSGVTLKWREQPDGKVFQREGKGEEEKNKED